mmetsp:Transcript_20512/g.68880  ORF Transcript_20512/g.68880 Transcript_20512/m.68880 type:complete len:299 (+) Transcript_20512:40-936(+)
MWAYFFRTASILAQFPAQIFSARAAPCTSDVSPAARSCRAVRMTPKTRSRAAKVARCAGVRKDLMGASASSIPCSAWPASGPGTGPSEAGAPASPCASSGGLSASSSARHSGGCHTCSGNLRPGGGTGSSWAETSMSSETSFILSDLRAAAGGSSGGMRSSGVARWSRQAARTAAPRARRRTKVEAEPWCAATTASLSWVMLSVASEARSFSASSRAWSSSRRLGLASDGPSEPSCTMRRRSRASCRLAKALRAARASPAMRAAPAAWSACRAVEAIPGRTSCSSRSCVRKACVLALR